MTRKADEERILSLTGASLWILVFPNVVGITKTTISPHVIFFGPNQNFRRVYEYTGGNWKKEGETWRPDVFAYYVSMACNHCESPACIPVCPEKAITKDENGFVVIDAEKCIGCKSCQKACPYGAPQYSAAAGAMLKCDGCRDRVAEGKKPVCVESCPLRALDFLPIDELRKKYGSLSEVAPLKPREIPERPVAMRLAGLEPFELVA